MIVFYLVYKTPLIKVLLHTTSVEYWYMVLEKLLQILIQHHVYPILLDGATTAGCSLLCIFSPNTTVNLSQHSVTFVPFINQKWHILGDNEGRSINNVIYYTCTCK